MKIPAVTDIPRPIDRVNSKDETDTGSFEQERRKQEHDQNEDPSVEVTEETVDQAIELFAKDQQALSAGLTAKRESGGRISIADDQGQLIRQLSGEEFVRLRESIAKSSGESGKILDQKF